MSKSDLLAVLKSAEQSLDNFRFISLTAEEAARPFAITAEGRWSLFDYTVESTDSPQVPDTHRIPFLRVNAVVSELP